MGLWDEIKKQAQNVSNGITDTYQGAAHGARDLIGPDASAAVQSGMDVVRTMADPFGLTGSNLINPEKRPDEPAKEDPRITALRSRMLGESSDFRKNLGKYKDQQYNSQADAARGPLDNTLQKIKYSSNQRGLLGSGMRQGAAAGARENVASMLARQRAEINSEAENLASTKDSVSAEVGLAGYGDAIKRSEDAYANATRAAAARRAGLSQIGEGVGYGFGALRGAKVKPKFASSDASLSEEEV